MQLIPVSEEGVEGYHAVISRTVKAARASTVSWWSGCLRFTTNMEIATVASPKQIHSSCVLTTRFGGESLSVFSCALTWVRGEVLWWSLQQCPPGPSPRHPCPPSRMVMCSTRKRDFASCIRGLLQEGHQQIFVLHSLAGLWADRSAAAARFATTHSHEAAVSTPKRASVRAALALP